MIELDPQKHIGKLCLVKWFDSYSNGSGWIPLEVAKGECAGLNVVSVGWIMEYKNDFILIVSHKYDDNETVLKEYVEGRMYVPVCAIKHIEVL